METGVKITYRTGPEKRQMTVPWIATLKAYPLFMTARPLGFQYVKSNQVLQIPDRITLSIHILF